MSVRSATRDDLTALLTLDLHGASADAERVDLLMRAIDEGACLVFVDQGRIQGFAVTKRRHFFGRDFVDLLTVHPDARRSGVGRSLLQSVVAGSGTDDIFTSTNRSNGPMRALLVSEGWQVSGELDGLDEGDPKMVFFIHGRS